MLDVARRALGRLGVAEAGVAGAQDGLGAVGHLELGEDGRDVVGDSLGAEAEPLGDVVVAVAGGQEVQDLAFAGGELWDGFGVVGGVAK
jgi:hypothetical protein